MNFVLTLKTKPIPSCWVQGTGVWSTGLLGIWVLEYRGMGTGFLGCWDTGVWGNGILGIGVLGSWGYCILGSWLLGY